MKRLLILTLLLLSFGSAEAYKFDTKMEAEVIDIPSEFYDQRIHGRIVLEVTDVAEHKENKEPFPVGSKIHLNIVSSHGAKYYDNPKIFTSVSKIILPDGSTVKNDLYEKLEIKPISGVKSSWIPFYRIINIFGSKRKRSIGKGSLLTIKPTGGDDIVAVLKNNIKMNRE